MPAIDNRAKFLVTGGVALAAGLAVGLSVDGDDQPTREAKLEALGSAIHAGSALGSDQGALDSAEYHRAVSEFRSGNAAAVDLLTGVVAPGVQVTTGVNLAVGARISGGVTLIGQSVGSFTIDSITYTDGDEQTWLEVKATNTSQVARRFVGVVELEP